MAANVPFAPDSDGQRGGGGAATLAALLAQTAAGDAQAFRDFHDRTCAKLFGIILRIVPERTEAEAVLHDAFVAVWRKAAGFDAAMHVSPIVWAAAIARNCAIDRVRSRAAAHAPATAHAPASEHAPAAAPRVADAGLVPGQDARRLDAALAGIDPRHAAAIRACYRDGISYQALAQRDGVPVAAVKTAVRRGLARVRARLDGQA